MTLHGSRVAWSLSLLMVLVGMSGCGGGPSHPCPHPYPDRGMGYEMMSYPDALAGGISGRNSAAFGNAPKDTSESAENLSLTYETQDGSPVTAVTELKTSGVNFFGSKILHVPLASLKTAAITFSVPAQSATKSAWDFDITLSILDGVQGGVTYYDAKMNEEDSQTTYQATLVNPGAGIISGTPGVQMLITLKKADGSVSKIWILIDLDEQTTGKAGN